MALLEFGFLLAVMVKTFLVQVPSEKRRLGFGTCLSHYCHLLMKTKQHPISEKFSLLLFGLYGSMPQVSNRY
jgi:hypothetical protein